jgi:DNA-binding transcriptional LysR family regulator
MGTAWLCLIIGKGKFNEVLDRRKSRGRQNESIDYLADYRFALLGVADPLRRVIDDWFESQHFVPKIAMETMSIQTIAQFVANLDLVTILSGSPPLIQDIIRLPLPGAPSIRVGLLSRDSSIRSEADEVFAAGDRTIFGQGEAEETT